MRSLPQCLILSEQGRSWLNIRFIVFDLSQQDFTVASVGYMNMGSFTSSSTTCPTILGDFRLDWNRPPLNISKDGVEQDGGHQLERSKSAYIAGLREIL
jgi:hypothetical protein